MLVIIPPEEKPSCMKVIKLFTDCNLQMFLMINYAECRGALSDTQVDIGHPIVQVEPLTKEY